MELEFAGFQLRLVPLLEGFLLLGEALDPFGMGADDDLVPVIGQELAQERELPSDGLGRGTFYEVLKMGREKEV